MSLLIFHVLKNIYMCQNLKYSKIYLTNILSFENKEEREKGKRNYYKRKEKPLDRG